MSAIPTETYAAIALNLPEPQIMLFSSGPDGPVYTGPYDAAEFLYVIREPLREWCKVIDNAEALSEVHLQFYLRPEEAYIPSSAWVAYVLNEEDKVRALAQAMGIEVGNE